VSSAARKLRNGRERGVVSEQFVSLARKDGRLVALVSVVQPKEAGTAHGFELTERRIDDARGVVRPETRRAIEAWRGLDDGAWDDPRVLSSALIVLLESVPLGGGRAGTPPLAGQAALCERNAWTRLRGALRSQGRRVLPLLRAAGYGPDVSALVEARDPYVAYHHGARTEPGLHALPPRFRAGVLPLLRSRPWPSVSRALSLFWTLDLQRDDALLAVSARLLAEGPEHGLAWLTLLANEDPSRRETFGRILQQTGALACDPCGLPKHALETIASEDDAQYADRLAYLLRGVRNGVDPAHVLEVFRIATAFAPGSRFGTYGARQPPKRHPAVPDRLEGDLWRILAHFERSFEPGWAGTFPTRLWKWSGGAPARAAVLQRPSLLSWPALTSFRLLSGLMCEDAPGWPEGERVDVVERLLSTVPESHQAKAVDALAALFAGGVDRAQLTAAGEMVVRLARPPFRSRCAFEGMAGLLVQAAGPHVERLARVPDRSLQRLERALCEDHSWLIKDGLEAMGKVLRAFLLDALTAHPDPLIAAARHVGVLSPPRRIALLKRFRSHAVSQRRFARRPLEQVCRTLEGLVRRGLPNPVPRKLREHRLGRSALTAGSLERHRQAIVRRLLPFRVSLLRLMALEEMARGVEADLSHESERHAVQMLGSVPANRRLLRRVLRLPAADRRAFLVGHPANRAWLARHPRVDRALWSQGLDERADLSDGRTLRIAFETDPLEVLRLGTRVGSCLSVGGICSGSAVAVMAGANKRVVFARDAAGAFVARQLVAITEDDRLVFFPVYPLGVGDAVEQAFERYDLRLAAELGLAICRDPDEAYAVAPILGQGFYDDGPWGRLRTSGAERVATPERGG
jgi:hypothetical protein